MTKDPKAVVRAFYDALARGDVPALHTLFADRISWTEAERFPYYGGTWASFGEVVQKLIGPLGRDWTDFSAKSHRQLAEDDEVVAFGTYGGVNKATGKTLEAPFVHHWRVENGRLVMFVQYTDTAKVLESIRA